MRSPSPNCGAIINVRLNISLINCTLLSCEKNSYGLSVFKSIPLCLHQRETFVMRPVDFVQ